ncbi:PRD domain-containing protein [Schleiferilactobacillus perolens]|nr:PRD domain-containing protein [Schleiferilactobacillus perolens]
MESNQDLIYHYVRESIYSDPKNGSGVTTEFIATNLQMQRTNVSANLNKLVRQGKLVKTKTRPVRFAMPSTQPAGDAFTTLIGSSGSLKRDIQLAKAAILYPSGNLNIQITAHPGSGTSIFVDRIIHFAEENHVVNKNGPTIAVNCRNYANDIHALDAVLFGENDDFVDSCFDQARGGVLFVNHYEYLTAGQQARIVDLLDKSTQFYELNENPQFAPGKAPFMIFSCSTQGKRQLEHKLPVVITLPSLDERPLSEKMQLINRFFAQEARTSKRTVSVGIPALKALVLSDYVHNIKELLAAITMACANAYVRVVNDKRDSISVSLEDLKPAYRKSLLKEKENQTTLNILFGDMEKMIFDPSDDNTTARSRTTSEDIYGDINKQYASLVDRGVGSANIKSLIDGHIKKLFDKYNYYDFLDSGANQQQLAKIVKPQIIEIVRDWLSACRKSLNRSFDNSVFYGLCLHINSLLTVKVGHKRLEENQAKQLIVQYSQEYKESVKLAQILRDELGLHLPLEETVLLMFFITPEKASTKGHPVVLYIMHGNSTASSLMETTNALNQNHNAYGYDLNLDVSTKTAMLEIKAQIQKIDQGQGVIVIYDMGSIKIMLETISEETNIKIRSIQIPITLIGIDAARKSAMETDVDYVYHTISTDIQQMVVTEQQRPKLIVTLCHTGEGGAEQLKNYIDQYSKLGIQVKALAMANKQELVSEVNDLRKVYQIHAFVGTFNPQLFGVPFIPINKVFENTRKDLDQILMFKPVLSNAFAYDQIYRYFQEEFKYADVALLKRFLPEIMDELCLAYDLKEDQRVGLFVHLGSMVERCLADDTTVSEPQGKQILTHYPEDVRRIGKILKPLEKSFKIIVTDDEIASIVTIVRKL